MNKAGADIVVLLHVAFVAFVVLGFALFVVGEIQGWNWVRNPWLRALHLSFVAYTLVRCWMGLACPLTVLENSLRHSPPTGWIAACHRLFFRGAHHREFTVAVTLFSLIVFAHFALVFRTQRPVSCA